MSVSDNALTTLDNLKEYMGISSDSNNTLLENCIDRASDMIDQYCNRLFRSRSRTNKLYWSDGTDRLYLKEYPITKVERIALGAEEAIKIENDSSDAARATVRVNDGSIVLVVTGGTNAGTNTLTLSDYTDIDALVTAIDALGSGWSAQAMANRGAYPATDFFDQGAFESLDAASYLEIPDDPMEESEFYIDSDRGTIVFDLPVRKNRRIYIDYTAGLSASEVPGAVEEACLELAAFIYNRRTQDLGMRSEEIGDYSYTRNNDIDIPSSTKMMLAPYRRLVF